MATDVTWRGTTDNSWNTASNWSDGAVPEAGDNVSIPAGAPDITSGLDQHSVTLGKVRVEEGFVGLIGDDTEINDPTYLQVDAGSIEVFGKPTAYVHLHNALPIDVTIAGSAPPALAGRYGIYLKGSGTIDLDDLNIRGGASVGLATFQEDVLDMGSGGQLYMTSGTCVAGVNFSIQKIFIAGGRYTSHSEKTAVTAVKQYAGTSEWEELYGNGGTWTIQGGRCEVNKITVNPNGPEIIVDGGTVDFSKTTVAKVVNSLKVNKGRAVYDGNDLTVTTFHEADRVTTLTAIA